VGLYLISGCEHLIHPNDNVSDIHKGRGIPIQFLISYRKSFKDNLKSIA
jgi:hypothetical protein